MTKLQIIEYLNSILKTDEFSDSSMNGIQVLGDQEDTKVKKIAVAVDYSLETIEQAISNNCNFLIVHHGMFWGNPIRYSGVEGEKLRLLINNKISLYASHLPLDAHDKLGNNISIAKLLNLTEINSGFPIDGKNIGFVGNNNELTVDSIIDKFTDQPGFIKSKSQIMAFGPKIPAKIGICSGGAADMIHWCIHNNVDTFITGEPKQWIYHTAKENKINMLCLGHYATETFGVIEVGKHLKEKFNIEFNFINLPTEI